MKKINSSGLFVVVLVVAALMIQCHYNKEEEPANRKPTTPAMPPIDPAREAEIKASRMEFFQDDVSRLYEGYSPCLHYGVFGKDGAACVKIGHGVPISKEDLKKIMSNASCFNKEQTQNAEKIYDDIIKDKKDENSLSFTQDIIRQYEADFIEKRQEEVYRPLCRAHGFEYDEIWPEIRAAIFCIDMATGGRIESYNKLLDAIGRRDWEEASKQCYVDAKTVFLVKNPYVVPQTPDRFNKNMKNLFLRTKQNEQIVLDLQKANGR